MIRRRVRRLRRLEDRAVDERHALERRVVAPVVVAEELIERALLRVIPINNIAVKKINFFIIIRLL